MSRNLFYMTMWESDFEQRSQSAPREHDPKADRSRWDTHRACDVRGAEVREVVQDQRNANAEGKRLDRILKIDTIERSGGYARDVLDDGLATNPPLRELRGAPNDDPIEPRRERVRGSQRG